MTIRNGSQEPILSAGQNQQSAESASVPSGGAQGKTVETLIDEAEEILTSEIDPMMREALRGNPEKLAEWDTLMQQCAEAAAEDQREAEEAKVAAEIREHMERISAEVDRLEQLDPTDLEVNEGLARNLAAIHEVDAIMRTKCEKYPAELAKWEEGVMRPVRLLEMMFVEAMHIENEKPGN